MYLGHFGLNSLPFENIPDSSFFYRKGQYETSLEALREAVSLGRGLVVVSGPIGAGKTTLGHMLVSRRNDRDVVVSLPMPPSTGLELYAYLAQELDCPQQEGSLPLLREIRRACIRLMGQGRHCLLVVDEAHLATPSSLEAVRILSNLEHDAKKLLQIILLGQDQLDAILAAPEMTALTQRIAARLALKALAPHVAAAYIQHRLAVSGATHTIFTPDALAMAAEASEGIPRVINNLSHRALSNACRRDAVEVDVTDVHLAAKECGLGWRTRAFFLRNKVKDGSSRQAPPPVDKPAHQTMPSPAVPDSITRSPESKIPSPPSSRHVDVAFPPPDAPLPPPPTRRTRPAFRASIVLVLSLMCLAGSILFFHARQQAMPTLQNVSQLLPLAWDLFRGSGGP